MYKFAFCEQFSDLETTEPEYNCARVFPAVERRYDSSVWLGDSPLFARRNA